ncbi:hypothetical protein MRB53_041121 [Persea americana]|nr:hypothetical protein MRB53_041121 [Persea americana]
MFLLGKFHASGCSEAVVGDGRVSLRSSESSSLLREPRLLPPMDGLLDEVSRSVLRLTGCSSIGSRVMVDEPAFDLSIAMAARSRACSGGSPQRLQYAAVHESSDWQAVGVQNAVNSDDTNTECLLHFACILTDRRPFSRRSCTEGYLSGRSHDSQMK